MKPVYWHNIMLCSLLFIESMISLWGRHYINDISIKSLPCPVIGSLNKGDIIFLQSDWLSNFEYWHDLSPSTVTKNRNVPENAFISLRYKHFQAHSSLKWKWYPSKSPCYILSPISFVISSWHPCSRYDMNILLNPFFLSSNLIKEAYFVSIFSLISW